LVEATYLLRRARGGPEAAINLVLGVGARFVPPSDARLKRAATLMNGYRNIPMDLVDALLVVSAEELGITEVLSLDRRGFGAYRARGRRGFSILP
jgi:predicted nucleic acid-binding protein